MGIGTERSNFCDGEYCHEGMGIGGSREVCGHATINGCS
jgi:hypothetical protein